MLKIFSDWWDMLIDYTIEDPEVIPWYENIWPVVAMALLFVVLLTMV